MSDDQYKENLAAFKKIKEIHQVLDGLGELIANSLYLSVKEGYGVESQEHARKMAGIHIGQLTTFLNDCHAAAQDGDTKKLLEIIEDWKEV